jgi:hypothetical protein
LAETEDIEDLILGRLPETATLAESYGLCADGLPIAVVDAAIFEAPGLPLDDTRAIAETARALRGLRASAGRCGGFCERREYFRSGSQGRGLQSEQARGFRRHLPYHRANAPALARWDGPAASVEVKSVGKHQQVRGTVARAIDGADAQLVLVAGRTPHGVRLFAVEQQPALSAARLETLDPTRRMARLEFHNASAVQLGPEEDSAGSAATYADALTRLLDLITLALAAEQVGCAQSSLDSAIGYAGQRAQFGQAIGSFQPIKPRCAYIFLAIPAGRSPCEHAAALAAEPESPQRCTTAHLSLASSVAKTSPVLLWSRRAVSSPACARGAVLAKVMVLPTWLSFCPACSTSLCVSFRSLSSWELSPRSSSTARPITVMR